MGMKKGFVFTTDMIIGLVLGIAIVLSFVSLEFESIFPEKKYEKINYISDDILNILNFLTVDDVKDRPTINSLIASGVLKGNDLNKTVLDLIGSFWYSNNKTIAENISREILENITRNICINITADTEIAYSSCNSPAREVAVRSMITSGYEIGKPVSGYVARAWATKANKNSTLIIPFLPEGSGWTAQQMEVTKKFSLSQNMTIIDAVLYVSIHFGTDRSQAEFQQLKVNDIQKKNDIVWLYLQESGSGGEITTAAFGYVNVKNEIVAGNNMIYLVIGTPRYNSHIHPGMRLVINYSLSEYLGESDRIVKKRYYFDDVTGRTGSWATGSFFLPPEAKNPTAVLHLKAYNVDDTKWFSSNATDVMVYVNDSIFFQDGTTNNCYYYVQRYYCKRDIVGVMNPEYLFNITSKLTNGTNVVSAYFNAYGDTHWGNGDARLYSEPLTDPNGSSYVEVSYILDNPLVGYGEIAITKETLFGGIAQNPKTFSFTIQETEKNIIESFTYITEGFSSMIEVFAWFNGNPQNLVFKSPSVRAIPSTVYIPPSIWSVGTNYIRMRDFQPRGSTSTTNYILPWTSLERSRVVKAIVGYGDVFNTSSLAIDDARQRLSTELGEDVRAEDIVVENKSVSGVRWLWGPSLFKTIVWEK